jgi:hypothetical protein
VTAEGSSLLTAEVESWIGRTHDFGPEIVTVRDVLRYLVATESPLPPPGETVRVPPLFYRTLGRPLISLDEVGDDGLWLGLRPQVGEGQTMGGGISVQFERELVVGDVVTGRRALVDLVEKVGRRRRFVVATWTTVIWDESGTEMISERVSEVMY